MLFNDTQLSGKWGGKGGVIILQGGVRIFQPPLQDTDPPVSNLGESLSRATPVSALKNIVSTQQAHKDFSLFTTTDNVSTHVLTTSKVRLVLRRAVRKIGFMPNEFGFHAFHHSGACWTFDKNIDLNHIKTHGAGGRAPSGSIFIKTPTAASSVARTFQAILN